MKRVERRLLFIDNLRILDGFAKRYVRSSFAEPTTAKFDSQSEIQAACKILLDIMKFKNEELSDWLTGSFSLSYQPLGRYPEANYSKGVGY